jgi:protein-disulfide isomerase-like protein with CxxC motif
MSLPPFSVTWDYRCPFARNAHEHLVAALQAGAGWDVTFVPFSLNQVHVEDGGVDVWDDPGAAPALRAMQAAIVVRDRFPDRFLAAHLALFQARHDEGRDIREEAVIRAVLDEADVDADAVFTEMAAGWPLETFRKEHEASVSEHRVFGVPTFIAGGRAVFVRLMSRPQGDGKKAIESIERTLELLTGWDDLNEFKHTSIPR